MAVCDLEISDFRILDMCMHRETKPGVSAVWSWEMEYRLLIILAINSGLVVSEFELLDRQVHILRLDDGRK